MTIINDLFKVRDAYQQLIDSPFINEDLKIHYRKKIEVVMDCIRGLEEKECIDNCQC